MRLFAKTKIDFMRWRYVAVVGSIVANVVAFGFFLVHGVNLGIDFTGGTEIQLKFARQTDVGEIRMALADAGLKNPTVTTIGDPSEQEFYIRVAGDEPTEGRDLTRQIVAAVRGKESPGLDLNTADEKTLGDFLVSTVRLPPGQAGPLAAEITRLRRAQQGLLTSFEELLALPGMSEEIMSSLRESANIGSIAIRSQNYVGPSVAPELRRKAIGAVIASMVAMLIYIGFRFHWQWGLGAILAIIHDVVITLGIFSLSGLEFSLPVVASFLTLVGYSVNDTIVVFDRIRENIHLKGTRDLVNKINVSINQTLGRTVITSGLTWLVCFSLYVYGGEALRGFAFVLVIGVIVGTYSSIYIASPVIIFWEELMSARRRRRGSGGAAPSRVRPRKAAQR